METCFISSADAIGPVLKYVYPLLVPERFRLKLASMSRSTVRIKGRVGHGHVFLWDRIQLCGIGVVKDLSIIGSSRRLGQDSSVCHDLAYSTCLPSSD
jgi:hypothetical protein